jgi:hypothetical protein
MPAEPAPTKMILNEYCVEEELQGTLSEYSKEPSAKEQRASIARRDEQVL